MGSKHVINKENTFIESTVHFLYFASPPPPGATCGKQDVHTLK